MFLPECKVCGADDLVHVKVFQLDQGERCHMAKCAQCNEMHRIIERPVKAAAAKINYWGWLIIMALAFTIYGAHLSGVFLVA